MTAGKPKSQCKQKARLLQEYIDATEAFLDSLIVLSSRLDAHNPAEYYRFQQNAAACRTKVDEAGIAFEQHIASHQC
jgi:hypothetical protein